MLMGFGLFNLVEGLVNHQILGLHHVNETVPRGQWIWWDLGFLAWGAGMLAGRVGTDARGAEADSGGAGLRGVGRAGPGSGPEGAEQGSGPSSSITNDTALSVAPGSDDHHCAEAAVA